MIYSFENLEVWKLSRDLVKDIYQATSRYPADERFGISSQLRRASISICSNIAEGSTRWSKKDQSRFYEIAFGSLIEALNQLILSCDLGFLPESQIAMFRKKVDQIARMLNGLYHSAHQTLNLSTHKPINSTTHG
jgi:four helix bundle protein